MRKTHWNRLAALCLTLMLILALGLPAKAADTASGADLRLTATEGTVTLKNSSGKTLSVRDNMKLYSGYVLSTSAKSYAYVTLDSTKVVKLDASTKVEIRKSGSKLELLVSAGKLFFNVKAPLSSGESLNIRTSTMVTGIRGTSGLVEVRDGETSAVSIYDGQVTVTTPNAAAEGGFQTATVSAGQTGTSLPVGSGSWQENLEDVAAEDIPGFAAVELQKDPDLQQRIEDATGLPVADIAAEAQQRLEADEQQAQAAQDTIDQAAAQLPNQSAQAPAFQEPEPDRDPTPSRPEEPDEPDTPEEPDEPGGDEPGGEEPGGEEPGGEEPGGEEPGGEEPGGEEPGGEEPGGEEPGGEEPGGEEPGGEEPGGEEPGGEEPGGEEPGGEEPGGEEPGGEEPAVTDYTIANTVTGTQLQSYLDKYTNVTVASGGKATIGTDEAVTVAEGKSLTLENGGSLINNGTLTNNGTIYFSTYGTTNSGQIENRSILYITNDFSNQGTITSSGSITISGQYVSLSNSGTLNVESNGSITVSEENTRLSNSGTLTVERGGSITNYADDTGDNTYGINNLGNLNVAGTITNSGWLSNGNGDAASTFGTITIQSGGKITNSGDIRNYACSASGKYNTIDIQTGGTLTNTASITNCGRITVSGTLTNNGTYSDRVVNGGTTYDGTVTNKEGGTISGNNAAQITSSSGYTDETTPTEP